MGDAIDCARILEFFQEQFTARADADDDADPDEEQEHFFTPAARLGFAHASLDLCKAFEALETAHRQNYRLTDKATDESLALYRAQIMEQRNLLARTFPCPAPVIRVGVGSRVIHS